MQQEIWTAETQQLMPSFTSSFGSVHPTASVSSVKCLRPSALAECANNKICADTSVDCGGYASAGYCEKDSEHYDYMVQNCCASCNADPVNPIRVRAWRELCNQTSALCVHVIVVNSAMDSTVQFELSILGLGLTAATNATRLLMPATTQPSQYRGPWLIMQHLVRA
jgi:hypothetical protein